MEMNYIGSSYYVHTRCTYIDSAEKMKYQYKIIFPSQILFITQFNYFHTIVY